MAKWPKDTQAARSRFYGDPARGEIAGQLVKVIPPFAMYYDGQRVSSISFHRKAAAALRAALDEIWDYYGHDQAKIDAAGVSKYAGSYNHRKVRGSATKWSNHAYGCAIDLNAAENGMGTKGNMPQPVIDAFTRQGAMWGGWYRGRTDPMHFEFVDNGGRVPSSPALKTAEPELPKSAVRGDPDVWHVQRRLKAMNYNPGGLDGIWGGMTSGAISGFINDRQSNIDPPTSASGFVKVLEPLKVEISVAESEQYTRPIAPERAQATVEEIGEKLPEVKASAQSERLGFWGSIAAAVASVFTGVSKFLGDAVEWLNPLKDFAGDIHWSIWVGFALALSAALYYVSRKSGQAKNAATQAYKEGARV